MRRIHTPVAALLGLVLAALPVAGYAVEQPSAVAAVEDCGEGAGSVTDTVFVDGEPVTIITDDFGACLTLADTSSTSQSTLPGAGASPAVPVAGRPAFTG